MGTRPPVGSFAVIAAVVPPVNPGTFPAGPVAGSVILVVSALPAFTRSLVLFLFHTRLK